MNQVQARVEAINSAEAIAKLEAENEKLKYRVNVLIKSVKVRQWTQRLCCLNTKTCHQCLQEGDERLHGTAK
jgi:hypothetical protein